MSSKVVQLKRIGVVTFYQNHRSKSIKLSVKSDKSVLVSFPYFVSGKEALAFVMKNEKWIAQQKSKMELQRAKIEPGQILSTKLHSIVFIKGNDFKATQKEAQISCYAPDFESENSQIFFENIITEVYRNEAKQLLPVRLAELAQTHDFYYNKVTIRNNRRNWGSCSSQNNISLNLQMMKLPNHLIDYILLHELVHTKIKNHSSEFWDKLNELTNSKAREVARELKNFSTYTL